MAAPADKTGYSSLLMILAFSAVPLLLAAAASLMGWAYRRDLIRREHPAPGPEPATEPQSDDMGSKPRLIPVVASADLGPAADQVLKDARDVTTRVHFAYLVAALAYAALSTAFLMQAAVKQQHRAALIMSYLLLASQIVVVTWFIRMSLRQRLSTFLAYSLIGSLLALLVSGPKVSLRLFTLLIYPPHGPFTFLQTPIGAFVICPLAGLYFLLARRMQPFLALLAASLLYIGAGVVAFYLIIPRPEEVIAVIRERPWLIPAGLANLVLGVILAGKLLRLLPRSGRVFGLATLAVAVVAIVGYRMPLQGAPLVLAILSGTAVSVLGVLFVWAVFKVFVWLQEQGRWLTPEILDAHFCWTYLTLCLLFCAWELRGSILSDSGLLFLGCVAGCVAALALHIAVLHTLLWRIRARRPSRAPKRLLLLRVFGRADEPEYLLDALDDTWRRIGAVDVLGNSDIASRTLRSSTLEAYLLRRGADQYHKTDEEVDQRLLNLRSEVEGDVRYPVNGVFCYEDVWQRAFIGLAQDADVVLMDLRGFTSYNRSCAWELAYLVRHTPLRRILLLVDKKTDRLALEREAQAAWTHLPLDSPNTSDQEPELKYLSYDRKSEADGHKLFRLLLIAAGDSAAIVADGLSSSVASP
jgi:hypothetical protein